MDEGDSRKLMAKVIFKASASLGSTPQVLSLGRLYRRPKDSFLSASFDIFSRSIQALDFCTTVRLPRWEWSFQKCTEFQGSYRLWIQNVPCTLPPPRVKVLGLGSQLGMVFWEVPEIWELRGGCGYWILILGGILSLAFPCIPLCASSWQVDEELISHTHFLPAWCPTHVPTAKQPWNKPSEKLVFLRILATAVKNITSILSLRT